ncbi:sphingomyelin phosphodiesterase [Nasonia vitripennis]|uniref:Sphingomyelin phosphodiesterase n=1 Tax=Nasonia vitripennis TaxID=7425 RepID=A0A7M7HGF6_NASVI|nr:sphingomyelin phosphodiesterase [Nasonia vitripennis]XP_008216138.1 sphingomyelin phosphodiesterase [Nasonia vitripennis]
MKGQKRLAWNGLVLFSCIAISQAAFLDVVKKPKDLITHGLTGIVGDVIEAKNNLTDKLNHVSPNILGPIADALDPDWLIGINYTRWAMDLDDALTEGDTTLWVKRVSKMFDVPRVIEEMKTSKQSKATCLACKFAVNLGRSMIKSGKSDEEVLALVGQVCTTLNIQSKRVCEGVMALIGVDVVEAVKKSDMRPAQVCSFLLGDACLNGYDARHDWKLNIQMKDHALSHPTSPPPKDAPLIKILQISDTHFDPYYEEGANAECGEPLCCRGTDGEPKSKEAAAGKWGDYRKCDAPLHLIENALKHISETHKDIDYVYWTGDLPPHDIWNQSREENLMNLRTNAALMDKYFKGVPILPSVGNHESCPVDSFAPAGSPSRKSMSWLYDELDKEWSRWLPASCSESIRRGAFYSLLLKPGFRVISVNGNYCSRNNFFLLWNSTDPLGELGWLERELAAAEASGERVHVIGHVPPGGPDCLKVWSRNYYEIISRYEGTVMAQFFGHTHFDEFEVFYDAKTLKRPLGVGYISPSLTPWENVNPAYRIYYVDGDRPQSSRVIVDHETWKMNLDEANQNDNPVWYKAYNARSAYNMSSLLPQDWDDLIRRMTTDRDLFETYHRNYYRNSPVRPKCDDRCRRKLLCDLRSGRSHDRDNLCHDL